MGKCFAQKELKNIGWRGKSVTDLHILIYFKT